jgi:hypothetical protein
MAAGVSKWQANARDRAYGLSAAWADEKVSFQIWSRWILLFFVSGWVIVAGLID